MIIANLRQRMRTVWQGNNQQEYWEAEAEPFLTEEEKIRILANSAKFRINYRKILPILAVILVFGLGTYLLKGIVSDSYYWWIAEFPYNTSMKIERINELVIKNSGQDFSLPIAKIELSNIKNPKYKIELVILTESIGGGLAPTIGEFDKNAFNKLIEKLRGRTVYLNTDDNPSLIRNAERNIAIIITGEYKLLSADATAIKYTIAAYDSQIILINSTERK